LSFRDREQQLEQLILQRRLQTRDHAEIEEGNASVVCQEHIAGMWISVEKSIDEDLLEIGSKKLFREARAVQIESRERAELGDLPSGHVVHRENSAGGIVVDRLR